MTDWQPIETAPKNEGGPNILLLEWYNSDDYPSDIAIGFWTEAGAYGDSPRGFWANWHSNLEADDEWEEIKFPTHWMPLPPPPEIPERRYQRYQAQPPSDLPEKGQAGSNTSGDQT